MKAISEAYKQTAIEGMSLNITEDEMFVLIPSERNNKSFYRVDMDEATMAPKSCRCAGFSRWKHCKHVTLVADAFAFYKPVAAPVVESASQEEETKITEVEAGNWYIVNSNTQVFKTEDGEWMAVGPTTNAVELVEAHLAVKEAERIVSAPVEQPATRYDKDQCCQVYVATNEPVDLLAQAAKLDKQRRDYEQEMLSAALTSNSGFSLLKVS